MFVSYDGIVFDVLLLNGWDQNAIWSDDGADFLFWHHLIDVTVILNPNVVSADVFPKLHRKDGNTTMKGRAKDISNIIKARSAQAQSFGVSLPNGEGVSQFPVKSSLPPTFGPTTPFTSVPKSNVKGSAFVDYAGSASQAAVPGVPNYPTSTTTETGGQLDPDNSARTSPMNFSPSGSWRDPNSPLISPVQVLNTEAEVSTASLATPRSDKPVGKNPPNIKITPPRDLAPPPGQPPRFRQPVNGLMPATEVELRDRLQVPRRRLAVWINSGPNGAPEYILNLPYEGCDTDAKHGPKCVDQNLVAVHGNVTGVKRLVFECFEALPPFSDRASGGSDKIIAPPLISNRWEMKQVPDQKTFLNSTVITGKAVFRMDVLGLMNVTPDQLRPYIMPPIAMGYVRRPPEVTQAENVVLYTIVDDQQMINNPGGFRWGVHSVVLHQTCVVNEPVDLMLKGTDDQALRNSGRAGVASGFIMGG